jgi:hypothetical protein
VGIILMRLGIPKIHEKPISEQLGDMPIKACDDLRTGSLIRTDHVPVLFGIELGGKFGGIDEVTKHDGELPSFRVGRRSRSARCDLRGWLSLGNRRLCWLSRGRGDFLGIADPDQNSVILISGKPFRLNQVNLQVFDVVII